MVDLFPGPSPLVDEIKHRAYHHKHHRKLMPRFYRRYVMERQLAATGHYSPMLRTLRTWRRRDPRHFDY